MANTQVIDMDKVPALKAARDVLSEETIKAMKTGAANTVDVAKQIGSDKLSRSAEQCQNATDEMIKIINCDMTVDNGLMLAQEELEAMMNAK